MNDSQLSDAQQRTVPSRFPTALPNPPLSTVGSHEVAADSMPSAASPRKPIPKGIGNSASSVFADYGGHLLFLLGIGSVIWLGMRTSTPAPAATLPQAAPQAVGTPPSDGSSGPVLPQNTWQAESPASKPEGSAQPINTQSSAAEDSAAARTKREMVPLQPLPPGSHLPDWPLISENQASS